MDKELDKIVNVQTMRILILLISLFLIFSCQPHKAVKLHHDKPTATDSGLALITSLADKFLIGKELNLEDSNQLFFYYTHPFDTSLLIRFNKSGDKIDAVIYQINQFYNHRGGLLDKDTTDIQFFEGFRFIVDTADWQSFKAAASTILNKESLPDTQRPFDSPTYILAFNSQLKLNICKTDDDLLSAYLMMLKNKVLYKCMQKKTVWHKEL